MASLESALRIFTAEDGILYRIKVSSQCYIFFLLINNTFIFSYWKPLILLPKEHIWTYSGKIKVPQCLYYDYICMYLCMSSRYSLHRLSYQAEIWTTKSTCDHEKMHFFLFWNFHFFGRYAHFIRFSQFHAYNTFTLTYHDDWYIKSNPWTSRKRCI